MAESLTCNLSAVLNGLLTNPDLLSTGSYPIYYPSLLSVAMTSGTGLNKVNQVYQFQRVLASGGSALDSISMYNGAITNTGGTSGNVATAVDGCGVALAFANIKLLVIQNLSATASDVLSVGNDGTSAAWVSPFGANTHLVKIRGGASLVLVAPDATGYAVVNTTNHLLKVLASTAVGAITYNLIAFGATA